MTQRGKQLPKCTCGSDTFIRVVAVSGHWIEVLTVKENGEIKVEGCGDAIRYSRQPKTIRCDGCGKRMRNPDAS